MGARIVYVRTPGVEAVVKRLVERLGLSHVRVDRVFCAVSFNSKTRAYARIWGLPGPFVRLGICEPGYVIELVYENVAGLPCSRLLGVVVHELLHIPRSFSGGLRSHGEWSRWRQIEGWVRRIPPGEREELCRAIVEGLEEARTLLVSRRGRRK